MKKNTNVITIIIPIAILCFSNIAWSSRIFSTRVDIKLDTRLHSVVTGDLNGDSVPDLAIGGAVADLLVLLGNGDGTFAPAVKYPISSGGSALAIGDLNSDGILDLAVAKSRDDSVTVLMGNGDGTFSIAGDYATGEGATSVTIGDLNGDQTPDMAVANRFSDDLSVLLGNGDGTFQMATNYAMGDQPSSVAMGDLDGDSVLDLVVVRADYEIDGNISVLLGNGDGTFGTAENYLAAGHPTSVVLGDLNGDSVPDLVTGNGNSDNISVLLGNGDGSFNDTMHYSENGTVTSVAIGDMNGDNIPDLVTANDRHENVPNISTVGVRFGIGDGTFQDFVDYPVGSGPESVAIGDFDGNGVLDLVTANYWSDNLSVLFGNGDGTFPITNNFEVSGRGPHSVAIGDLNGDGISDMATADSRYISWIDTYFEYNVSVLLGNGDGTFQKTAVDYQAGDYPRSVAIDDFDGDSRLDLAVANMYSDNVSVLLGRGDGTFHNAMNFAAGEEPYSVDVGDLNDDGASDLVVANSSSDNISILMGNGDGTFRTAMNYQVGDRPVCVTIGDLDGDGAADLVTANSIDNDVSVLLGNGDGIFRAAVNYQAGEGPASVAIGDLDEDGVADLVTANSIDNNVSVLLGNGDGTFRTAMNYQAGDGPSSVAIGDLDGDGVLDLAVAIRLSANVAVLNGNGDGTFQSAVYYIVGTEPQSLAIDDLDQDGALDLAVANWYSCDVTVLKNRSVTLCEVNPMNRQVAVPMNTTITSTFNQAMAPSSIDSNSFYLLAYDYTPLGPYPTNVSGSVSYSGVTATFTPSSDLLPETRYEAHVTASVQNLSGLHLSAEYIWEFTTGRRPAITGAVTDSDGQYIVGSPVCAYDYVSGQEAGCSYTEQYGRFTIIDLPSGVYRIYADTSGTEYRAEYYDNSISSDAAAPVEVIDGETTSGIDFILEKDTDPYDSDTDGGNGNTGGSSGGSSAGSSGGGSSGGCFINSLFGAGE